MKQVERKDGLPCEPGSFSPGCLSGKSKRESLAPLSQMAQSPSGQVLSFSFLNGRLGAAISGKMQGKCSGDCGFAITFPNGTVVFAAFDGVGGKPDDFFASRFCAESAKMLLVANPLASMQDAIIHAEKELMASAHWQAYPQGSKPGCTACLVRVSKKGVLDGAYAGDCFAVLANGTDYSAKKLTIDQRSGEDVGLSCYIGKNAALMCEEVRGATLAKGDALVVSSDGLENVLLKEIGAIALSHSNMENAALELVRLSNSRCDFSDYDTPFGSRVQGKSDDRLVLAYLQE